MTLRPIPPRDLADATGDYEAIGQVANDNEVRLSPRDLPAVMAGVFLMIVMIWLWSVT